MSSHTLNLTTDLTWPWSITGVGPLLLLLIAAVLVALTVWTYLGVPRANWRRVALLVSLRLTALLLAVLALVRPSLASRDHTRERSLLLLLLDASESMTIQDEFNSQSRWDALRRTIERCRPVLDDLRNQHDIDVRTYRFAEQLADYDPKGKADGKRTDYGEALQALYNEHAGKGPLRGVLLCSDGLDNGTRYPTLREAEKWRAVNCPLHTFAVGSDQTSTNQRDIFFTAITADPSPVPIKHELIVKGLIDSPGFENTPVRFRLFIDDKQVDAGEVRLTKARDNEVSLKARAPDKPGEIKVTLRADPQIGEVTQVNNEISTYVTVTKEGLSVLYVDKLRYGEPRALMAALHDPRISLTPVFRQGGPLSEAEKELFRFEKEHFDVIILGDLSFKQFCDGEIAIAKRIYDLVTEKGTGIMVLGGYHSFGNSDWQDVQWRDDRTGKEQKFAELFPVELNVQGQDESQIQMVPTPAGLAHYLLRLIDKPDENRAIWERLPKLRGMTKLGQPKAGATVLATGNNAPLLVGHFFGKGRTLAFGADTTWRWRNLGLPDKAEGIPLHERFWKQCVIWLAHQEDAGGSVWVKLDARRLPSSSKLDFSVGARGKDGAPLKDVRFETTVTDPKQAKHAVAVTREGEVDRGTFWKTELPGEYHIEVKAFAKEANGQEKELDSKGQARFLVYQDTAELARQAADPAFLAKVAGSGGGKAFRLEELPRFLTDLRNQPLPTGKTQVKLYPDWRHGDSNGFLPGFLLVFVLLLCLEWFLRRIWGLV
jgi:uncharacterized membrane protein